MVLIFYALINLIGIFYFVKLKKNIHILEILVYWMASSYLFQNFSALCVMNFKTLVIPDLLSYELTDVLNRIVLFPLLMVTFLNYFRSSNSYLTKLLISFSYILLLTGLEWSSHLSGVLLHVHWKIWWSLGFWMIALWLLVWFEKFFRKLLYRGGAYR
jgi:hypothetical protein